MLTIDQREQRLNDDETLIARLRARQMEDLQVSDQAQVATGDGSRSLSEWVSCFGEESGPDHATDHRSV